MRSYAEREVFTHLAQAVWADAVALVARVSHHHGNEVRCHELARAAHRVLYDLNKPRMAGAVVDLLMVDGSLWSIEHSWLVYRERTASHRQFILDVYCPGWIPQVQLIDGQHFAVARGYVSGAVRSDIDSQLVQRLTKEMERGK